MKKVLSIVVLIAFTTVGICLFKPLTTKAQTGQVIFSCDFEEESDLNGWATLNNFGTIEQSDYESHSGNYSMAMSSANVQWETPYFNIYQLVKAAGAGTYHFSAWVSYNSYGSSINQRNSYMLIRGLDERDANSFISQDVSGNYFNRISTGLPLQYLGEWFLMTGSVKVSESDIKDNTGNFLFCFDGLPYGLATTYYFDDIQITKLNEEGITNGDFDEGITGWRHWDGVAGEHSVMIDSNLFGHYLRVSDYGSIACNVDQILSYYGPGEYTLSFKIKTLSDTAVAYTSYLTTNFSEYHKWIGRNTVSTSNTWQNVSYTFNISIDEFYNNLEPDYKEVHFRLQTQELDFVEYLIDDVTLVPTELTNYTLDTFDGKNIIQLNENEHERLVLNDIVPQNAPSRCTWTSSNDSIASVDENGFVCAISGGVVTITAYPHNSNSPKSFTLYVQYTIPQFQGFGQELNSLCWAACAKMVAYQYAKNADLDLQSFAQSLKQDVVSINHAGVQDIETLIAQSNDPDAKIALRGGRDDRQKIIEEVYLTDSTPTLWKSSYRNYSTSSELWSAQNIFDLITNDIPVIATAERDSNYVGDNPDSAHVYTIYGFEYTSNGTLNLITYDPFSNSKVGSEDIFGYTQFLNGTIPDRYYWSSFEYLVPAQNN